MNCYFCKNEPMNFAVREVGDLKSWFCQFCPHSVRLSYNKKENKLITANIFRDKNDHGYQWHFNLANSTSYLQADGKCIIKFNYLPNINPKNFENKLKIYLTFS